MALDIPSGETCSNVFEPSSRRGQDEGHLWASHFCGGSQICGGSISVGYPIFKGYPIFAGDPIPVGYVLMQAREVLCSGGVLVCVHVVRLGTALFADFLFLDHVLVGCWCVCVCMWCVWAQRSSPFLFLHHVLVGCWCVCVHVVRVGTALFADFLFLDHVLVGCWCACMWCVWAQPSSPTSFS
jgi:hypothetical protein